MNPWSLGQVEDAASRVEQQIDGYDDSYYYDYYGDYMDPWRTPITVIRMDIILDQATMSHMSTTMTMYGMILDRMVEQLSLYCC